MYTRQQISLIEGIPQSELFEREMNELIDILNQLKIQRNIQYFLKLSFFHHY